MKSVARKRAIWCVPGIACALLAGLLWELESGRMSSGDAMTASPTELGTAPGPQLDPLAAEETREADADEVQLPPDAGILPVETLSMGNRKLDVVAGEVLAKFSPAISKAGRDRLLASMGSKVLLDDPITGYLRVMVPRGEDILAFQQRLNTIEGVIAAHPNVIFHGTANKCNLAGQYYNYQWSLGRFNHAQACNTMPNDPSNVVVAVLDTGVAYENYGAYQKASDLTNVPVVYPYDFINNDSHANDDHRHGTHIATTILGMGRINGVTPGATLMPIKVLDANNQGSELALAQGIRWAVDNGARILNMSLSFPTSYVPSGVLQDAVTYASSRGALLIASTGNAGADTLPYPAAFRDVLSIGSVRMKRLSSGSIVDTLASYSNNGPGVDLVAPGGALDYDADLDGWPDGVLAQTIKLNDPSKVSYYFYSGTSQAAALATGIATWLVAMGATPDMAREAMINTATDLGDEGYDNLYGAGVVSLYNALAYFRDNTPVPPPDYYANIFPVVYQSSGKSWAVARIRMTTASGAPMSNARISGQWSGSITAKFSATTNSSGYATVASPQVTHTSEGELFSAEVNMVVPTSGRAKRPKEAYYLSQGMSALLNGALDQEETQQAMIAYRVSPSDTSLGTQFDLTKLSNCFTVKAVGPSLGTPGIGITFTPELLPGLLDATVPKQEIAINFGGPRNFGDGTRSSDSITVFNNGVGLAVSGLGRGVGLAVSGLGRGVGLAVSGLGRLGGVGLAVSQMGIVRADSSMISGASAGGEGAELVLSESPDSFISKNSHVSDVNAVVSLNETRFAVNSTNVSGLNGVITANSAEELEMSLEAEAGAAAGMVELGDEALSVPVITDPE